MRCINCGIAVQRLQRHIISSLPEHHQARLSRWITVAQTQLPLDTFICHPCLLLLNTEAGEQERLLAHNQVCVGCGKSVRKRRHHNLSMECPLLAILLTQNPNYVPERNNYVCHLCWMRANRQAVNDLSRDRQGLVLDNNAAANNDHMDNPPVPPPASLPPVQKPPVPLPAPLPPVPPPAPLPPVQRPPRRECNTIAFPNYKRASISSSHCIFQ